MDTNLNSFKPSTHTRLPRPKLDLIYLASPYTAKDPEVTQARYDQATLVTAALLRENYYVYSPIVHNHILAECYALPTTFDFWGPFDLTMLEHCDYLLVLALPGWENSLGVRCEIKFAQEHMMPMQKVEIRGSGLVFYELHP